MQLMQAVYTELHAYGLNMKRMQACSEVEGGKHRDAGLGCIKERLAGTHQEGAVRRDGRGVATGTRAVHARSSPESLRSGEAEVYFPSVTGSGRWVLEPALSEGFIP